MRLLAFAFLVAACSSANSSNGTLAPSQVNVDEPSTAVPPPPSLADQEPPKPPPPLEQVEGCPSNREASDVVLTGVDDVRTRLAGVYRDCEGGSGIELRADADSDTRLRWYLLDRRFVRIAGTGTSGTIDISDCEGAVCTANSHTDDGTGGSFGTSRELTVYDHPTAFRIALDLSGSWTDYLRVAD